MNTYQIFLSSPGDVMAERARAQAVVDRLNAEFPGGALLSMTRWEQSYYSATETFQAQVKSPGEHDIVAFIFWKRLGTDLPAAYNRADGTARTGTEYEFEEARDARERRDDHLPDILVYRKTAQVTYNEETVDIEQAQKKALDQFWEKWFRSDTGHYIAGFHSITGASDFEQQFERNLREWLHRRHTTHITWSIALKGSPYRGLDAIDETHSSLFFGRDTDINRARARFIEAAVGTESGRRGCPFLLILGASGSGKSSFLRAGLVPRMRAAGVPAFRENGSDRIDAFCTLTVVPRELGADLCRGLAAALYQPASNGNPAGRGLAELAEGDYRTPEAFAALSANSPASAAQPVLRALERVAAQEPGATAPGDPPRQLGLLLVIDQLEELFTRAAADRGPFVQLLSHLVATGRVFVAATMRNDFYDRLREDPDLSALVDRGRLYNLAPPTLADYREIIRRPAQAAGLRFEVTESRDLGAEIEAEAGGEGALPMIAFLLDQLYRERRDDLLTLDTYDKLGGAAGALARRGDQLFGALPAAVQDAFPRVVRRLVRKSIHDLKPTAAPARLSVFAPESAEKLLVDALCEARLLRTFTVAVGTESAVTSIRWSHEALLTCWPQLGRSVDADRRDYETLDRLQAAYVLWQNTPADQKDNRLISGLALEEARDLVARWTTDVDENSRRFLDASWSRAQALRRRQTRRVTATITVLSVLTIAMAVAGYNAVLQRNRARAEQETAARTVGFMVSLFEKADPSESRGDSVTVREMLDRGAGDISKGLEKEPQSQADLLTAMGQAYSGLGLFATAKRLLAEAQADQHKVPILPPSRVRTLVAYGNTLYLTAEYADADKILNEAVNIARRELAPDDVLRSKALDGLGDVLVQEGKFRQAQQLYDEALAADRQRGGPDHDANLASTLDALGNADYYSHDFSAGEAVMREALSLHIRVSGYQSAQTAVALNNLGVLLYDSGQYDKARDLYQQALSHYRKVYGEEHPEMATLLNNIGRQVLTDGSLDQGEPLLRQALAMDEKFKGSAHDDLVAPLNSLAMIDAYRGNVRQALAEIHRAEQIARQPDEGRFLSEVLLNAADMELRFGDGKRSAALLAESHRLLESQFPLAQQPAEAWRYAAWNSVRAELVASQGDAAAGRKTLAATIPILQQRFGAKGFDTLVVEQRGLFIDRLATRQHPVSAR